MSLDSAFVRPRFRRPPPSALPPSVHRLADSLADEMRALLDPDRLDALAFDLGVVTRDRKHHMGLVVASLVLSSFARPDDFGGRWLDAQSVYRDLGGPLSAKSSFRDQCRHARRVLQVLFQRILRRLGASTADTVLGGRLAAFADILIPDGCAFKLASCLAGYAPGTGNAAELKIHAVYRVSNGVAEATLAPGRQHDNEGFAPAVWESNALYIWDLGYNDHSRFVDAVQAGAIPLQRLKDGANPIALAFYNDQGRHPLGTTARRLRLNEACEAHVPSTGVLDLDVELRDGDRSVVARVVCVPFEETDRYYLTTLGRDVWTPFDVAELYRIRWEIELLFKSWKGAVRMDNVHRLRAPEAIEVHVWAALVAVALGRSLHHQVEGWAQQESVLAPETKRLRSPSESRFSPLCSDVGAAPRAAPREAFG